MAYTNSIMKTQTIANGLSVIRIVFAPVLAFMVLHQNPSWSSFTFAWVLGSTDKLDGILARRSTPSRAGAFLDTVADKILLLVVGFAVAYVGAISWVPMILITIREVGMTIYRIYWSRHGLSMPARASGKYKAFIQGIAITSAMLPLLSDHRIVVDALMWIAVAFTYFSAFQYIADGRSALSSTGEIEKSNS